MLVKEGYLAQPIGIFCALQDMFCKSFYGAETLDDVPELTRSNYYGAFWRGLSASKSVAAWRQSRRAAQRHNDFSNIYSVDANATFHKDKSLLTILQDADWDIERIPDSELPVPSLLAAAKIGLQHRSGKTKEVAELIRRWEKKQRMDFDSVLSMANDVLLVPNPEAPDELTKDPLGGGELPMGVEIPRGRYGTRSTPDSLSDTSTLMLLQWDIENDVCSIGMGGLPYSSINYFFVTFYFHVLWKDIESALSTQKNKLYLRAFNIEKQAHIAGGGPGKLFELDITEGGLLKEAITSLALQFREDQCLRTMANVFENHRSTLLGHIYWNTLETPDQALERVKKRGRREVGQDCR